MADLIWLPVAQNVELSCIFHRRAGLPEVDDRRIVSGIVLVIRNALRWRDAPSDYGPHKLIDNRFIRWNRLVLSRFADAKEAFGKEGSSMSESINCERPFDGSH
jgi:transposase